MNDRVAKAELPAGHHEDWALRPWLLSALLAATGLLVWLFSEGGETEPWRMAAAAFVFFGGIAAAFTLERNEWKEPLVFSLLVGVVMAGLAWRAVAAGDRYSDEEYGFMAGVVATAIALPLFQAGFHRARFATSYERVHYHVWSDALSAAGALAFTGASWLLLLILSELFNLLEIRLLSDMMDEGWFAMPFTGAAFGAALGTLRNQLRVLGTLQSVAMLVLSILAVPLAAGLVVFLVAMAVSGPDVLWRATRSATPVLLMCAAGAWVLANAILRDDDRSMSGNRVLRAAALALALTILPLTVFAAVSMGTRIDQHGLSPERLWGLVAIAVACAFGIAWAVAVIRGCKRGEWRERLRQANLHIAVLVSAVALLLALPILDFGAISARNQIARLESGQVSPDEFDYAALRWEFGEAGRRALDRLEQSDNPRVAELARLAQLQTERVAGYARGEVFRDEAEIDLRVEPEDSALRALVIDHLRANPWDCPDYCVALDLGRADHGRREVALVSSTNYTRVLLPTNREAPRPPEVAPAVKPLGPDSEVEVRTVERRYIFVDGRPVGPPLEDRLEGMPPPR